MKNFFDFTGKKYLVTGASSGIGRAVAVELAARQGAYAAINGRNEERLNDTARVIQEARPSTTHTWILNITCGVTVMRMSSSA